MKSTPSMEVFVLAGGQSSRMGKDKGLIHLKGRPMVSYVLQVLEELALPISIIANSTGYESFGYRVLKDEVSQKGPMGGLYTALQNSSAELVLLVACDMPMVTTEAFCLLMNSAAKDQISVAAEGEKINPLLALYPRDLKEKVKGSLDRGDLKMADFILRNRHILVTSIGERTPLAFRNINDKNDLKEAEKKWEDLQ